MTSTRPRRTQAERTAETRRALLDATLDALVEVGFKGTTTTEVARRAGVSVGALQGHFPTKIGLLTAAIEFALNRRIEEFEVLMAGLDPSADKLDEAFDLLWSMFSGQTFTATHELWVAARTDPDLAPAVVETDRQFAEACERVYTQLLAPAGPGGAVTPQSRIGLQMAFALMNGLAMARLIDGYEPLAVKDILETFKTLARPLVTDPADQHSEGTQ
ncbi:TetR family transcriptional regulator [Mycolicibacter terrae]|uniref:TetR family transcriptional regulator n=1 Tax=Mycolicibacter terrae TaxID=1788 RepID=A0AAD1MH73_9MYCO|nr:TetR/AcrR family transcriptional regulator [Mycolicibacter terrae]ORW89490.1 TetR family transcriptional regulator [Mycolicibacter terrae]BBX21970.1 TetR family transcriptional regulator [Mycolicibacter terrae]SNV82172.1 TetR family transcriptional regulator [Mycolicibacter terrae]